MNTDKKDRVLLAVLEADRQSTGRGSISVRAVCDALGVPADSLADQVGIMTGLSELLEEGWIRRAESNGHGSYVLTPEGRERTERLEASLRSRAVQVRADETYREMVLADAVEYLDRSHPDLNPTLPGVLERLATDERTTPDDDAVPVLSPEMGATPSARETFVDRTTERERLREIVDTVRTHGTSRVVVIAGPGGVGKSRLLSELLEWAEADGYRTLLGTAGTNAKGAFQPIRSALAAPIVDGEVEDPFESGTVGPPPMIDGELTAEREMLFDEVTDVLSAVASGGPLVVGLEDLHRANSETVAFLERFLEHADAPILLVGTVRSNELGDSHPLSDPGEWARSDDRAAAELDSLDRHHTDRLVQCTLDDAAVPPHLREALFERTGGNPLFVLKSLTALREHGEIAPQHGQYPRPDDDLPLPADVGEAIDRRFDPLDHDGRTVLETAALAGTAATSDLLEAVTDLPRSRIESYFRTLVDAHVIEPHDDGVGFVSGVVRERVRSSLSQHRARSLHGSIAAALERPTDESAEAYAQLAHHDERAGNHERAIEAYRDAGVAAADVFAVETAIEHHETALELAREHDLREHCLDCALALVEHHVLVSEYRQAEDYLSFVNDRLGDDPGRRQRTDRLAARVAVRRGDYDTAVARATAGLDRCEGPSEERCRLLAVKAAAERDCGKYDRAMDTARQLHELASELDATDLALQGERLLGDVAAERGDYELAREHYTDALAGYRRIDDRHNVGKVHAALGRVARGQSDYDQAEERIEQASEVFESVGNRHGVADCRHDLAVVFMDRSDYETAREHLEAAMNGFESIGDGHGVANAHETSASIYHKQGRNDLAVEHHEQAIEQYQKIGDRAGVAMVQLNRGNVAFARGNWDRAREQIETAMGTFEAIGDDHSLAKASHNLGNVATKQAEREEARERYRRALAGYETVGDRHNAAKVHQNLGCILKRGGDCEAARESLQRALAVLRELGDRHQAANALLNLGGVASQLHEYDEAYTQFERAYEAYDAVDARHGVAMAVNNLGHVAVRRGDYSDATQHFERAMADYERVEARLGTAEVHLNFGLVAIERGEYERAAEHLDESLEQYERIEDPQGLAMVHDNLGVLHRERGEFDAARKHLQEALDGYAALGKDDSCGEIHTSRGLVALEQDAYAEARESFETARDTLDDSDPDRGEDPALADLQLAEGRLALATDDPERTVSLASEALEAFESLGERHSTGQSHVLLGRGKAASGDHFDARAHWRTALDAFEDCSVPPDELETLKRLVEFERERGDAERVSELSRRACSVLENASEAITETHREWIDREESRLQEARTERSAIEGDD